MHQESNILKLIDELLDNTYTPSKVTFFIIHDPVCREICAASFRDRIVHHFLHTLLYPIVDKQFIADSYAARTGK
jgi:RNA-directed DNA polymerase